MKTLLKLLSGLFIGIAAGLGIAALVIVLFTDTSWSEFIGNLRSGDAMKSAWAAAVGMVAFLLSLAVLIPAHEAGHLVCGLMTGYKFVSFRIFNLTFIKVDGRLRVKRFSVAGTGGQCLLTPPDRPLEQIPTAWYNAGGVLADLLLLGFVSPLFWFHLQPLWLEVLWIFGLTDVILILMNGVPMKLGGIGNDGYNMLNLRHNMLSKRAFVIQLRSNALIQEGKRPQDMPADWFEWKTDIDYTNPLEVSMPLMHATREIDRMDWESAYREFDALYQHRAEIMPLYGNEIACELAFCAMMTGRPERAAELLDARLRKYIEAYRKVMSSKQRIMCGIALYLDNDREQARQFYEALAATKEKYLLQGEVKSDLAIMAAMLDVRRT